VNALDPGRRDAARSWTWDEFTALPAEDVTVDIHCVTKWSRLDTSVRALQNPARADRHDRGHAERRPDVPHSGLSIAMGQSGREVHRAARHVTTSNEQDGFANAVERFIVGTHDTATLESPQRS